MSLPAAPVPPVTEPEMTNSLVCDGQPRVSFSSGVPDATEYEKLVVPVWFHLTVALNGPPAAVLKTPMTPLPPVAFGDVQPVSTAFLVLWCAFGAGALKLPHVTTTRGAATAGLPSATAVNEP